MDHVRVAEPEHGRAQAQRLGSGEMQVTEDQQRPRLSEPAGTKMEPESRPGREPASHQMFLHVEGPDGLIFSYVNGMAKLDGKPRLARQFPLAATSLCDWGSESKDVPELGAPA